MSSGRQRVEVVEDLAEDHRIDPVDAWSELRYDVIVPVALFYTVFSILILCPPNFREWAQRFNEWKREHGLA